MLLEVTVRWRPCHDTVTFAANNGFDRHQGFAATFGLSEGTKFRDFVEKGHGQMARRRTRSGYRSGYSGSSSWNLSAADDLKWPFVKEPVYPEFRSIFRRERKTVVYLTPQKFADLIWPTSAPAIYEELERDRQFPETVPHFSAKFPDPPSHPGEPPKSSAKPEWEDFAPPRVERTLWESLVRFLNGEAAAEAANAKRSFDDAMRHWKFNRSSLEQAEKTYSAELERYVSAVPKHHQKAQDLTDQISAAIRSYDARKAEYQAALAKENSAISELLVGAKKEDIDCVQQLSALAIEALSISAMFGSSIDVRYDTSARTLLFEVPCQSLEDVSFMVQLKTKSRAASEREIEKHQEQMLQMIPLLVANEIFRIDELACVELVGVNVRLSYIEKATGQRKEAIVSSLAVTRDEFRPISLSNVDPKACFRALKGISTPSFRDLSPVRPVLTFNEVDHRVVSAKEIADHLDPNTNLAAMAWEDFEHIVRELFAKLFTARSSAAEVHVTRASRDYGVDAIIHDPDPIHGGKFVVQAKRYVNRVDVSAVRDLFGTLQNEGANRGFLVTTSNFGPDAFAFAKDKPITLINGPNLLQLLQDHGYTFRIDLDEARQLNRKE